MPKNAPKRTQRAATIRENAAPISGDSVERLASRASTRAVRREKPTKAVQFAANVDSRPLFGRSRPRKSRSRTRKLTPFRLVSRTTPNLCRRSGSRFRPAQGSYQPRKNHKKPLHKPETTRANPCFVVSPIRSRSTKRSAFRFCRAGRTWANDVSRGPTAAPWGRKLTERPRAKGVPSLGKPRKSSP